MRAPLRPLPESVSRWTSYAGLLRWLDAAVAFAGCWIVAIVVFVDLPESERLLIAAVATVAGVMMPAWRVRWRPISGIVGIRVSRKLRPGDHAWFVRPGEARLVLVTGRRRLRLIIAMPGQDPDEGLMVRRTRVLVVPA